MFTILDLGKELKKLENFDKDKYITKLEKEVARFIRNADLNVINHQKMYAELRAAKHTLWMARAKNADLMSCKEAFNQYAREHPYSIWNNVWDFLTQHLSLIGVDGFNKSQECVSRRHRSLKYENI